MIVSKDIIKIRSVTNFDVDELKKLFEITISDIFTKNDIIDPYEMKNEIEGKSIKVYNAIINKKPKSKYYVAETNKCIIGIAGYSLINNDIKANIEIENYDAYELGTVYILPEYQRIGVGTLLIENIIESMKNTGIYEFYLDCGYKTSQLFWLKKFGTPYKIIKNKFGENQDYMIWKVKTED